MPNIILNTVREYEDFVTKEESNTLLSIAQNAKESDWFSGDSENSWYGKLLLIENSKELKDIYNRLQSVFNDEWKINHIGAIQRFNSNFSTIGRHSDEVGHPEIRYGCVIYLNDDYEGGEIVYPDLDIEIKPKANSLVLHPGNVDHLVNPVKPGKTRYMLTTFIHHPILKTWSFDHDS
jgi:hypothetical protein